MGYFHPTLDDYGSFSSTFSLFPRPHALTGRRVWHISSNSLFLLTQHVRLFLTQITCAHNIILLCSQLASDLRTRLAAGEHAFSLSKLLKKRTKAKTISALSEKRYEYIVTTYKLLKHLGFIFSRLIVSKFNTLLLNWGKRRSQTKTRSVYSRNVF